MTEDELLRAYGLELKPARPEVVEEHRRAIIETLEQIEERQREHAAEEVR